LTGRRPDG